jgi:hypothetical protein
LAMFDTLYDVSYIMPVVNSEMGAWSWHHKEKTK